MYDLDIIVKNGVKYIDSRNVANYIGKNHKDLLRDLRGYIKVMEKRGERNLAPSSFFVESSYISGQNKETPCYLLTKLGCELCANKLIGVKGVLFTAAYVAKFNAMETAELEAKAATPRLKVFNDAVRNVLDGLAYTHSSPERVMEFLRGAYQPFGIEVNDRDWDCDHVVSATDIAALLHIYSASGRPHSHAVSAIIEKLNIAPEHIAVVPFGLVGVAVRYDSFVWHAVDDWLMENNYPNKIPHLGFEYHVFYDKQISFDENDFYEND